MVSEYTSNENGQDQSQNGPMPPEGFHTANAAGVLKILLSSGDTFEDQLLYAGLPQDEAEDIASMFRTGVAFQVPDLVLHAQHSLIAAAADGDKAKIYALMGVTGRPVGIPTPQRKPVKQRLFGKGKVDARTLS